MEYACSELVLEMKTMFITDLDKIINFLQGTETGLIHFMGNITKTRKVKNKTNKNPR